MGILAFFHRRRRAPPRPPTIHRLDLIIRYRRNSTVSTATLNWTVPTTRIDGSPLLATDIASIDIFDSASGKSPIGNVLGAATSFTTGTLSVGVHDFTAVVNDTSGHVSAASNTAAVTVAATLAAPSAISDLAATLNP
jgi:hypothetical protein